MRLSELMGAVVVDEAGTRVGPVRDVRVKTEPGGPWTVSALVVGRDGWRSAAAHAWGFAEGRASGPALVRRLLGGRAAEGRIVPAERVASWGPGPVRLSGSGADLSQLRPEGEL